jgi:peptidoglycan-N-acetylglucosamine deacetylase
MHHDFLPYYVRVGDSWTKIDYSKKPESWMKPLERGQETDLIEIPASWHLDDLPPMMFIKRSHHQDGPARADQHGSRIKRVINIFRNRI